MAALYDIPLKEVKQWLDDGNTFALPFGSSRYVMRKLNADGSYVAYHYEYSTFGQLMQYSASFAGALTENNRGEAGDNFYDLSYKQIRERLDNGSCFSVPISNNEGFKMIRTEEDGCYIFYSPERQNFEAVMQSAAQYGPAWLWEQSDASGQLGVIPLEVPSSPPSEPAV